MVAIHSYSAITLLTVAAFVGGGVAQSSCEPSIPPRPSPTAYPYHPAKNHEVSPPRTKTCYVQAFGNGQDDSQTIFSALKACNNGGTVALLDAQYTIARPLDLTFLNAVDLVIAGEVSFTPDIAFWTANSLKYSYQTSALFWQIGGTDVNIYGGGTINGNGQVYWDALITNSSVVRPHLMGIMGLQGGTISNLNLKNPPNWFHFVANSSDVLFDSMKMTAISNDTHPAANSDGWDLYRSDSIVVQNSYIYNDDDCVSFKPNSTNIVVQHLVCVGSHGISVGSLGQYAGEVDIAENLYIYNISMTNATDGARIKILPGVAPGSNATGVGGGSGYVRNVTYNGMHDVNDAYAIELNQCYESSTTLCAKYPSSILIEDILFQDFTGTASTKYAPIVGTLVCSSTAVCQNIVAENINITTPTGVTAEWTCTNVDKSTLAINCV